MYVVVVDSLDSFTWNLVHGLGARGARVDVVQSASTDPEELLALGPDRVVLGPGPGRPEEAGSLVALVTRLLTARVPTLGVCLGMQAIAVALGGEVVTAAAVHGHTSRVHHDGTGLFAELPPIVEMTRYHSLVVRAGTLPPELTACAWAEDGTCMALRHREAPLHGVQFHPESVLSGQHGQHLLRRFLDAPYASAGAARRPATNRAIRIMR